MKVLVITGDKNFKEGHPRFDLEAQVVEKLSAVFWGKGHTKPEIPEEKFDVVTVQDPFWRGLFALITARRIGAEFNVQVHANLSAQSFLRKKVAKFVLKRADSVRVVSEKLKEQVISMGVKRKISVFPIFVDFSNFRSIVRRNNPKTPKILWIGRFEKEKDPLEAISVLEKVLVSSPDVQLIMLGNGSMTEKVIKRANNLPIIEPIVSGVKKQRSSFVKIHSWKDPIPYLATADVVLCTSQYEGWGASIVEALAAGIPVVAPDVGVAKEAGAYVVPREKLADAVIDVLNSGKEGKLQMQLIESPQEWAEAWKKTLDHESRTK